MDFAYQMAPSPRAYPAYPVVWHPEREYRRAIFRQKYGLIYRLTETELTFLVVHGTKQRPLNLLLAA